MGWRFGLAPVAVAACGVYVAAHLALALACAGQMASPALAMLLIGLGNGAMGLVMPAAMVQALEGQGAIAGLAASLSGTVQMGGSAVALALWMALPGSAPAGPVEREPA